MVYPKPAGFDYYNGLSGFTLPRDDLLLLLSLNPSENSGKQQLAQVSAGELEPKSLGLVLHRSDSQFGTNG